MTKTIKQQLQEIRDLDKSIDSKIRQVERLRAQAECLKSMDFSKDRITGGVKQSSQDVICRCVDLEKEITADIDRMVDMKKTWISVIDENLSGLDRAVLQKYYFEHRTWEQTAVDLNKDYRWIHRVHGRALEKLRLTIESHTKNVI